jgi:hypothetical protein
MVDTFSANVCSSIRSMANSGEIPPLLPIVIRSSPTVLGADLSRAPLQGPASAP